MEMAGSAESARCAACGAELIEEAAGWCPRCGEALVPADAGWDVALSALEHGARHSDQTTGFAGADASSPVGGHSHAGASRLRGWRTRPAWLKSRRTVLALVAASAVVLAGAATGGSFAIRAAIADARALFPVTLTDQSGVSKLGYIDKSGTMVIEPGLFSDSPGSSSDFPGSVFSEGLAPVTVNGKTGFIDTKGRVVIQPRFSSASNFHDGRALVWLDDQDNPGAGCAYIDKTGAYVVPPGQYSDGHDFSEGLAAVKVTQGDQVGFGYIDPSGVLVIQPQFKEVGDFSEGLAPVQILDHYRAVWGYIDKTGKWAIEPQFDYANGFSEGFAAVMTYKSSINFGDWGYIDKAGLWLVQPIFAAAGKFSEGLACVSEAEARDTGSALTGYIDRSGAWAIVPSYAQAGDFSQGVAPAMPAAGSYVWGYVDHKGNWVIQPKFAIAGEFMPQGLALVELSQTPTAAPSAPEVTNRLDNFAPNLAPESQPISAYIDKAGRIVWQSRPSGGDSSAMTSPTTTTHPGAATSSTPPSSDAPPEVIYGTSPSGGTPPSIKIDENPTVITVGS